MMEEQNGSTGNFKKMKREEDSLKKKLKRKNYTFGTWKDKIKINITSKRVKGKIFEVDTDLKFEPKEGDTDKAYISIIYSALIEYEKEIEKKELEKIILVKIPSEIFPDLKKIITTLFEGSGFKDFNLGEVDFQKLFESQKKN